MNSTFSTAPSFVPIRWASRLCDRVCEAVLEALLSQDVESRAQLDACAKLGMVRKGRVGDVF
jgi:S-adenosylmethionine synthetase